MVISQEIKDLIEQAPMVPIATVSASGEPHLIVVDAGNYCCPGRWIKRIPLIGKSNC